MADYDLGTAHGRIVIRSDNKGASDSARSLLALQATINNLNRTMAGVQGSFDKLEQNLRGVQAASKNVEGNIRTTSTTVQRLGGYATSAANQVKFLTTELANLGAQAVKVGGQLETVTSAIDSFSSLPKAIGGLTGAFGNLEDQMQGLPGWARQIVTLNRSISGFAAAGRLIGGFTSRIGALVASTAAFGLLSTQIGHARRNFGLLVGTMGLIFPSLNRVGDALRATGAAMGLAGTRSNLFARSMQGMIRGASQAILGFTLLQKSVAGITRAAKGATLALAATTAAFGAMKLAGGLILGIVNAVTQMSGALLVIPGIVGQVAITTGVAKLGFDRLKVAVEAAGKTGAEFDDAIKELSPTMQGVAKSMQGFSGRIKGLRDIAADQMFAGLEDDIKNLGDTLIPFAEKGVAQVGRSLNSVKNSLRDFVSQPQTIRDMEEAFALTGVTINNISRALLPALNGVRDFGIEGMKAFTNMTGGLSLAAKQFEAFAANARKTGAIQGWIREGVQGFKDLGVAIAEFGRGSATIFRAFGADGTNALSRMRESAENFNKTMAESARSGSLRTVAESLGRMSDSGLAALKELLNQISNILEKIAPFAERMSTAFGDGLVSAIQAVGGAATLMAQALGKLDGVGEIVGTLLAFGVALKGMQLLMIPIIRSLQLMSGAFLLLRGVSGMIGGINGQMRALGASTTVASVAMAGLRRAGSAVLGFMGGPLGIAIMTVVGAMYALKSSSDATSQAQEQYATNAQHAAESTDTLVDAFERAGGVIDKGVFDQLVSNIRILRTDLEETAKTSTGFWADLGALLQDFRTQLGNTEGMSGEEFRDQNDAIDETARKAQEATTALKDLGVTDTQIAQAVAGTQGEWDAFTARLRALGSEGEAAVAALQPMRGSFVGIQESMARMGPDSVALAEAFRTLAETTSSAAEKLDAIRSALTALGILESSATEAAFRLTETIAQVGEAASGALGPVDQLGNALLNEAGNGFNTSNGAAKLLHDELKKLGDALIETAAVGGDVNGAYGQMDSTLNALATQAGLSRDKIDELARSVGVAPQELTMFVNLKGSTEAQAELQAVLVEASRFQGQTFTVTAQAKTEAARAALSQLGFDVKLINSETGEIVITGNTADAQTKLQQVMTIAQMVAQQRANIPVTTNAPTITGQVQQLGAAVQGLPPAGSVPISTPGVAEAQTQLGVINQLLLGLPPVVQMPVQAPGAPAVGEAVQEIQGSVAQLPPGVSLPTQAPGAQDTANVLGQLFGLIQTAPTTGVTVPVTAPGAPESTSQITDFNNRVNEAGVAANNMAAQVTTAMGQVAASISNMVSNATSQLQGLGTSGYSAGAALGQGFADGIASKVDAARAAALALAEAAAQPLPRSPAEIGPFSGRGWTPYRGEALALGFASGIVKSIPDVRDASMDMATQVAKAIDGIRSFAGMPGTSFDANRLPGASGSRFYRDPSITDEDINKKRLEKERAKADEETLNARFKESDERKKKEEEEAEKQKDAEKKATKNAGKTTESMQELADKFGVVITSNKRNEPGSFHNDGSAFDFSGPAANMAALNAYLARKDPGARELFYDPGVNIDEGSRIGGIGGHSDHVHYVPSLDKKSQKALVDTETGVEVQTEEQEKVLTTQEKMLKELEKTNSPLLNDLRIAQDPNSSDADVIRALQNIDDSIATTTDREVYEGLTEVRDAVQEDRGIKKYDPFEGASKDPIADVIKIASGVIGLFDTIKGGLDALTTITGLLARGISSTADISTLVDGFQGALSTVGEIASTIGTIIETAGSLAALAGLAIPGIGPAVAAIGLVASNIGIFNTITDLIQEGFNIAGWALGGLLSSIAGGAEGPLNGNIRVLLDRNDNTIKTWSDANPDDKRIHQIGPGSSTVNNNGPQSLAVYAGPGTDPYQMMGEAMYAVRASNAGVFG